MLMAKDKPCFLGEEVKTRVRLESEINDVCVVNGTYVHKTYALPEHAWHESAALRALGSISSAPPIVIGNTNQTVTMNYIGGAVEAFGLLGEKSIHSSQLNVIVARYIFDVYRACISDQYVGEHVQSLSCEVRFAKLTLWLSVNSQSLAMRFPEEIQTLREGFLGAESVICERPHVFVHRDLHTSNVLLKSTDSYFDLSVIDCEHALIGPLELEFLNSRFWHDQKSLDVEGIVSILKESYNVPFDKEREQALMPYYVVDQLYNAFLLGDEEKMGTIMNQYRGFQTPGV